MSCCQSYLLYADPFMTYEEVRERGRNILAENASRSSPFLSRRSMLRGNDAGQFSARESVTIKQVLYERRGGELGHAGIF